MTRGKRASSSRSRISRLRRWLHRHGRHDFCRIHAQRVEVGRDFGRKVLGEKDGQRFEIDITTFGGDPVYDWKVTHE